MLNVPGRGELHILIPYPGSPEGQESESATGRGDGHRGDITVREKKHEAYKKKRSLAPEAVDSSEQPVSTSETNVLEQATSCEPDAPEVIEETFPEQIYPGAFPADRETPRTRTATPRS